MAIKTNLKIKFSQTMIVLLVIGSILITGGILLIKFKKQGNPAKAYFGAYDDFARCLTEKGVKIYGASWSGHYQDQKKSFGVSFGFIDFKDCAISGNPMALAPECKSAGIKVFPTWEFSGGARKEGNASLEELSKLSGCILAPSSISVK